MNIKKILIYAFLISLGATALFAEGLGPIKDSAAYKRYQLRPQTKLSELIYLMDRFNVPGVEIKADGSTFTAEKAFPYWKINLNVSYDKETAEEWINRYCYRSDDTNQVIYIRASSGDFKPVRDVFLEELKNLRSFLK